jgi:fibronectin-binding autotransporter adhesin
VSGANGNSGLIVFKQTGTNTLGTLNFSANNTSVDFGTNTSIDTINLSSATHIVNLNTGGASANVGAYDDVSFTLSNSGMIRNRWGQNTLSTAITLAGNGVIANRGTTEAFTFSGNVSSSAISGTQTLGILTDALNGHQGTVTQSSGSVISNGLTGGKVALTVGANSTSGTVTLAGTNTYTGATTVNGGTLVINGNQSAATGDVTVNNPGTRLKGTGTIGGDTTINAGAIHSVGNSVGKQTFHDGTSTNLTYAQGSIFEWELGATLKDSDTVGAARGSDWDAVNVSGTLAKTGDGGIFRVVLNGSTGFGDVFWLQDREWTDIFKTSDTGSLVDFESVFTSFQQYNYSGVDGALADLGDVSTYGSFAISGSSLTWTAVPEPTSALAGLLIVGGLLRRRRHN